MATTKYDKNWNTIGHISDDGRTMYDKEWKVIGHISEDGKTIHDEARNVTGHVSDDGQTLYDKDWTTIGHVSDDGRTIYDKAWNVSERADQPSRVAFEHLSASSHRSTREGNWVLWLIGAIIVLVILYLIFMVVVPLAVVNVSALALIASFFIRRKKKLLQWSSVVGLLYLFIDFRAEWLSYHLTKRIEISHQVIDYIVYLNIVSALIAAFFLIRDWLNVKYPSGEGGTLTQANTKISEAGKRTIYVVASLIALGGLMIYGYQHFRLSEEIQTLPFSGSGETQIALSAEIPEDFPIFLAQFQTMLRSNNFVEVVSSFEFPIGGYLSRMTQDQCIAQMRRYWRGAEWTAQNIHKTTQGLSVDFPNADLSFEFVRKGEKYRVVAVYSNLEGGD